MWNNFNSGSSIGTFGSDGIILRDEESEYGRITLEKTDDFYAITCGEYGSFVHTAFFSTLETANCKFEQMKTDLEAIFSTENGYELIEDFVCKY